VFIHRKKKRTRYLDKNNVIKTRFRVSMAPEVL